MSIQDFIKNKIEELFDSFEELEIRYAFDDKTNFHVIEIESDSSLWKELSFITAEDKLYQAFCQQFPEDDLLITAPDALTKTLPTTYIRKRNSIIRDSEHYNFDFGLHVDFESLYSNNQYQLAA